MQITEEKTKMKKKNGFCVLVIPLIIAVTIAAVVCAPMEQESNSEAAEEVGKLRVITITQEKIKGEYYTPSGGIHFQSEINGEYHFLSVTTPDGEPIVMAKQFQESETLMTVTERNFLVTNTHDENGFSKYTDYVVPGTYLDAVESALKKNQLSSKILRQLDDRNTNETRQIAFEELALRDEIELITEAARTLGKLGITGNENPAALPFYVLAMRLQKYRNNILNDTGVTEKPIQNPQKRQLLPALYIAVELYELIDICVTGRRPWYGYGSNCHGMCGPGCECWSWACGDCCVHQGCRQHDTCCGVYGYWSWECLSVWNFSCSSYSC